MSPNLLNPAWHRPLCRRSLRRRAGVDLVGFKLADVRPGLVDLGHGVLSAPEPAPTFGEAHLGLDPLAHRQVMGFLQSHGLERRTRDSLVQRCRATHSFNYMLPTQ